MPVCLCYVFICVLYCILTAVVSNVFNVSFALFFRASTAPAGLGGGFSSSTATGRIDSPSRICCAHKPGTPGQYEKTWLAPKAPLPPLSPRTKQLEKLQERDDVAAVRGLPTY